MGYRSDVKFIVAFPSETLRDEVLAIYSMHPKVQELGTAENWVKYEETDTYRGLLSSYETVGGIKLHPDNKSEFTMTTYVLVYHETCVKWYPDYEDVEAVEHMFEVIKTRYEADHPNFPFAWKRIRVGEDVSDIEVESEYADDCETSDLLDTFIQDRFYISVDITHGIQQDEAR